MPSVTVTDMNINNLVLDDQDFDCYIICQNSVYNEDLLRMLISKNVKNMLFYGRFDKLWEQKADDICIEYEEANTRGENWVVTTASVDLLSFIYDLSDKIIKTNKILIYDDENLKDYVIKRLEGSKSIKLLNRKERIELSCFTKYSKNVGLDSAYTLIAEAGNLRLDGLAITDILSTESFYEAQLYKNKRPRVIYGCTLEFKGMCYKVLCNNSNGRRILYSILSKVNTIDDTSESDPLFYLANGEYRGVLMVGMDCLKNNCFAAALKGDKKAVAQEISKFDYIEVAPPKTYLLEYNASIDEIKDAIRLIIEEARKQNILVVATNKVCYARKDEALAHKLLSGHAKDLSEKQWGIYQNILPTEEMKYEFDWLQDDNLVDDIVVNNTHKIARKCDTIILFDEISGYPYIVGAYQKIEQEAYKQLHLIYGENIDPLIKDILIEELKKIYCFSSTYYLISELCKIARDNNYEYKVEGAIASNLVSYLLGISKTNPLPMAYDNFFKSNANLKPNDITLISDKEFIKKLPEYIKKIAPENKVIKEGICTTISKAKAKELVEDYAGIGEDLIDNKTKQGLIDDISKVASGHIASNCSYLIFPDDVFIQYYTPLTVSNGELCTQNTYSEFLECIIRITTKQINTSKDSKNNSNKNLDDSKDTQTIVPERTDEGIIICPDAWEDGWK